MQTQALKHHPESAMLGPRVPWKPRGRAVIRSEYLWPVALLAVAGSACGGAKPATCDKSEVMDLTFAPEPRLNPDREGNPRSVVVRLYQLKEAEPFMQAGFEQLWSGSGATGGPVVAGPDELTLIPGKQEVRRFNRHPKATYVGVTANFREHIADTSWKGVAELPAPKNPCENEDDLDPIAARIGVRLMEYMLRVRGGVGQ
jgi:type VI secretion system protein VasD